MNHYVPEFDMDGDHNFNSTSSTITRHKVDDEILELLWQDGQVIAQPQNQRKPAQPTFPPPLSQPQHQPPQHHLYMAEDEMATWLHYPLEDLYSELISETQPSPLPAVSTIRQPEQPLPSPPLPPPPLQPRASTSSTNFGLFSRMRGHNDLERTSSLRPELTVVESNSTPAIHALGTMKSVGEVSSTFPTRSDGGGEKLTKDGGSGEVTISSSSGTSGGGTVKTRATTTFEEVGYVEEDRKRKRKEIEECNTETTATGQDLEQEADNDEKKHSRGHSTGKRSRAAEVHNLSERRRRDRINERMKALQELIPRCNKSDKASMLDEAIEYLKSLQMQVQMMSMGCNMVPMMYPGMQQYMQPMGMAMGMDMGVARPMMQFPTNVPGSNLPIAPGAAAGLQYGQRFAIPPAHMPSIPSPNVAANQTGNQVVDPIRGPQPLQIPPGMAQVPNMGDPYQQYMAMHQMQMQMHMQMQQMQAVQNQAISQPGSSKPSTSKSEAHIGPSTSKTEGKDDL